MSFAKTPAAQRLSAHFASLRGQHMRQLFAEDAGRFERMHGRCGPLLVDYAKHRATPETLRLLGELARQCQVEAARDRMFAGEAINETERRPALHVALRAPEDASIQVDGKNVVPEVQAVRARMRAFVERVHCGEFRGYTGERIRHVVNLGIGGSDLGPVMATEALKPFARPDLTLSYVSNVDGSHLFEALKTLSPAHTLFVVASKTFTTQETMANAESAKAWLLGAGAKAEHVRHHFVALSTNAAAVRAFGIDQDNMFGFWEWVGGRYSLWSAVGLSIALAIGNESFDQLLAGARAMDEHFLQAPLEDNLPITLACLGLWYVHWFNAPTHVVLPYEQYLHRLPAYLQQADMESNGKSVTMDGQAVSYSTGPILWGEPGTNGQHAFYQLLHQGTHLVPADFICSQRSLRPMGEHHRLLLANCLAQSEAMMRGRTAEEAYAEMRAAGVEPSRAQALAAHRAFAGNRPSTTIVLDALTPFALGHLIALYEHKIFAQGILWGINSFDQWGVELGKQLAHTLAEDLRSQGAPKPHDASTLGLLEHLRTAPGAPLQAGKGEIPCRP